MLGRENKNRVEKACLTRQTLTRYGTPSLGIHSQPTLNLACFDDALPAKYGVPPHRVHFLSHPSVHTLNHTRSKLCELLLML
jgi:hypothetical protein